MEQREEDEKVGRWEDGRPAAVGGALRFRLEAMEGGIGNAESYMSSRLKGES